MSELPLIVAPEMLLEALSRAGVLVVDLRKAEDHARAHVPGAVHLAREAIVASRAPVGGLLPDDEALSRVLSAIGLTADVHVIAYDEEGGGWAGRLLWTLDVLGHEGASILDGGWCAWQAGGYPTESGVVEMTSSTWSGASSSAAQADTQYILRNLKRPDIVLLDTRTPEEYAGVKLLAARGGHIPGAVNMDWVLAMDKARDLRLRSPEELRRMLERRGVTPDKEVIVYCQTHHRSSHTYVMLKSLGYPRIRGYPGAWSAWGNRRDTPVEC